MSGPHPLLRAAGPSLRSGAVPAQEGTLEVMHGFGVLHESCSVRPSEGFENRTAALFGRLVAAGTHILFGGRRSLICLYQYTEPVLVLCCEL